MATIFIEYLYWHFAIAPGHIVHIMMNYMHATWRRFLIPQHLQTLFSPWRRRQPSDLARASSRTFGQKILDAMIDVYIRILAAFVRLSVIVVGCVSEVSVVLGFLILLIAWIFWPGIALYLVVSGIYLLF